MSGTSNRDPVLSQSAELASTNGSNNHQSPTLVTDKSIESGSSDKFSGRFAGRMKQNLDVAVVCVVIVVVWVLLALPTVFYHLPESSQSSADGLMGTCIPENYTGSVCREVQQTQQGCLPDRNATGNIIISMDPSLSQQDKEEQARQLIAGLPVLDPSPECLEVVIPFLCFYIFPLCDSSGRPYQPSAAECNTLTGGICAREFETAAAFLQWIHVVVVADCKGIKEFAVT